MTTSNLPAIVEAEKERARALATSPLLPPSLRKNPGSIMLIVGLGEALGLAPAVALTSIQVIDGQPSLSAQAQAALVRRAGHKLRVTVAEDGQAATAVLIRSDDPDYKHASTWTMQRAEAAGLAGRGAWRQYPQAMLMNRATTEVIRMAASDVLLGAAYTPDELGGTIEAQPVEAAHDVEVIEVDADTGEVLG